MTTQEAIDKLNSILGGWSFHAGFPSDAGLEALAVLTALAEENKALARRAEALDMTLCSWMDSHKEMSTERDALKAEVGELNEEIKIQQKFVTRADEWFDEMMKWKARAEKAEAEVATLTDRLMSLDHDFGALVYENQRALAELERARPLLEAVEQAILVKDDNGELRGFNAGSHNDIMRAALNHREGRAK